VNWEEMLIAAGEKSARATAAAKQADAERDLAIGQARYHGGLSVREISNAVGISHQRVGQIIKKNPLGPERPSLHQAMVEVMTAYGNDWVPVREVALQINERTRYRRRDREPVGAMQVRARAAKHSHLFEGTRDGTNRIRLRGGSDEADG
jgi:hypothetical protein